MKNHWQNPALRTTFEYRPDGWPLCPRCGEDELMSNCIAPAVTDELQCLSCFWVGKVPVRK